MPDKQRHVKLLRIFLTEDAHHHGHPLYKLIINEAHRLKLDGATVLRGIMGYCKHKSIHSSSIIDLSNDLPLVIEIVEQEANLKKLLPFIDTHLKEGLVTIEDITVLRYLPFDKSNGILA